MSEPTDEEMETVQNVVNNAYALELGDSGLAFKSADRFVTINDAIEMKKDLVVAKTDGKIVGVVGASVENGVAELGPIAVSPAWKGKGIGSKLLRYMENLYPITMVGVVSCRIDLMPFYAKRGYITTKEDDLDDMGIAEFQYVTRRGLKYIWKQKINFETLDNELMKQTKR